MPEQRRYLLTEADKARLVEYERRTALLNTKFLSQAPEKQSVFDQFARNLALNKPIGPDATGRMVLSLPSFISETWSELLFLEPPSVTSASETEAEGDWIKELIKDRGLAENWLEDEIDAGSLGEVYWKVRLEDGADLPMIDTLDPRMVIPRLNRMNRREVMAYDVLAKTGTQKVYSPRVDIRMKVDAAVYLVERHTRGMIEYRTVLIHPDTWEIIEEKPGGEIDGVRMPPKIVTGIDRFCVIHVPNYRRSRAVWGVSDYFGLEGVFDEINQRCSKISTCLDILSNPKLQGPDDYVDDKGNFAFANSKYYPLSDDAQHEISAIVWDPMLASHLDALGGYIEKALSLSGIWGGLFFADKGGQAESGRALAIRMMKTAWRTKKKQTYRGRAIAETIRTAAELSAANDRRLGFEPMLPQIEWASIVPMDDLEAAQSESLRVGAGLSSHRSAIRRLNPGITDAELDDEIERIDEEEQSKIPDMLRRGATNPGTNLPRAPAARLPASL